MWNLVIGIWMGALLFALGEDLGKRIYCLGRINYY